MLFGSDMVDVTTPDGRRITVPQQLAAQFPGLKPAAPPEVAQPPALPVAPPAPAFTPQDQADIAAAQAPTPAPTFAAPPAQQPDTVTQPPAPPSPSSEPATPKQFTDRDLAAMGTAGTYNAQAAASADQRAAAKEAGRAQADAATAEAMAREAADAESARLLEERRVEAEKNAAELDTMTRDYQRAAKAVADTKIDRSIDNPILAAIGVALGGIGAAMAGHGGQNPALDMLFKVIDRKVAGQMQDLDKRRGDLATQREGIGMARQRGMDRLTEMDAYRAGVIEQTRREIATIAKRSESEIVLAQSGVIDAALQKAQADDLAGAQQRFQQTQLQKQQMAQSAQQHRESLDVQLRGQDLQQREADLNRAERAQEKLDAIAAQLWTSGQKERAEKVKANAEKALGDPTNGEALLQPEGQALMKDAAKLEKSAAKFSAAAAKEADPNKKQALTARAEAETKKALDLKATAAADHVWQVHDEKARGDLRTGLSAGQTIASTVGEINKLREKHGARWFVTTEGEARMQSLGASLTAALKDAWGLGVLSKHDFEFLAKGTGGDPTKITPGDIISGLGVEGNEARLNALVDNAEVALRNKLGAALYRGDFKLRRDKSATRTPEERAAIDTLRGKTPQEIAASKPFGLVGAVADYQTGGGVTEGIIARGSTKYPGLAKSQEGAVDLQLKAYRAGQASDDEKAQEKSAKSGDLLVGLATDNSRPSLRNAMLTTLRANAPELYERALAKLPEDVRREVTVQTKPTKRPIESLSDTERAQLEEQRGDRAQERRDRATEEERYKYRKAYDEQAQRGALGAWRARQ